MSSTSIRTAEEVLRTYFRAKDENRPHLMRDAFSETATLETIVKTDAISFPPISRGLGPITDVLVRKFAQLYENVHSFYLERPPSHVRSSSFSCDWLVGMSEKESGKTRVGCGRYDWQFQTGELGLADRLVITIESMQVLSADSLEPVLLWLTGLPHPWCPAPIILATAPAISDLDPIFRYVGRQKPVLRHDRREPLAAKNTSPSDQRPSVGVAHVALPTDRMTETAQFMRAIGMRPVFEGSDVSVFEMRGGTHLRLMRSERIVPGEAAFDLMVDDLGETHRRFTSLGLSPSAIEARPRIDHDAFTVREPAGHVITFFSSHVSGKPV